jgi:SAM-dependent methyltransferase
VTQSALASAEPDRKTQKEKKRKRKEEKKKGTPRTQDDREKDPQQKQSANSGIFSLDEDSAGPRPGPSKTKRRKSAGPTEQEPDDSAARDAEAKAAARAEKQQQREQQRREAASIAAITKLRPEEEEQLEKGAALLLRKLKSAAEAKRLASSDGSNDRDLAPATTSSHPKDKSLQTQYKKKLSGARFRYLNEMLYTSQGADSFRQFQEDPALFDVYHSGFREQVEAWPVNPVDIILKRLARLEQRHSRRDASGRFAVADFGCGDAAIAQSMSLCGSIVHSFDLVARNDWVTSADMAHVPLPEGAVHAAVFSLSLMGVNYIDYIVEAHRVVAPGGRLLIAEVTWLHRSVRALFDSLSARVWEWWTLIAFARFLLQVHSRIEDFDKFEKTISTVGFLKKAEDKSNKMFVLYEFERLTGRPLSDLDRQTLSVAELKPCLYKRR